MNRITIAFVGALLFTLLPTIATPEEVHELVTQGRVERASQGTLRQIRLRSKQGTKRGEHRCIWQPPEEMQK